MGKPKSRGNNQGTAIKRGNTWQAKVLIGYHPNKDGTKLIDIRRTKDGFKTKREALAYCEILKQQYSKPAKAPTVEFYWKAYSKELEKLSESKQVAYKIAWERMESIKFRQIDSLSVAELRSLVSSKTSTYYPARDMKVVLSHIYKLAGADQWVDKSLPDYIILPELDEKEQTPFSKEEQQALWKAYESDIKDAAIPLIMIHTGMMPGEMLRLSIDMIDLEAKKITGVGMKTKVRKKAEIYLSSSILPVVQDAMENKKDLLFPLSKTEFYRKYYSVLEKAGCRKLTPYSCRHTTATALAINENIAPQTIKKVMRWSTSKMLDRYAHPVAEDASAAVEKIGQKNP